MVLRAEPHEVRLCLCPGGNLGFVCQVRKIERKRCQIDGVDERKLQDLVVEFQTGVTRLVQHWGTVSVSALVVAKSFTDITDTQTLVGSVVGVEGGIVRVSCARGMVWVMQNVVVGDLLVVRVGHLRSWSSLA
jgi:hypothetical protein